MWNRYDKFFERYRGLKEDRDRDVLLFWGL